MKFMAIEVTIEKVRTNADFYQEALKDEQTRLESNVKKAKRLYKYSWSLLGVSVLSLALSPLISSSRLDENPHAREAAVPLRIEERLTSSYTHANELKDQFSALSLLMSQTNQDKKLYNMDKELSAIESNKNSILSKIDGRMKEISDEISQYRTDNPILALDSEYRQKVHQSFDSQRGYSAIGMLAGIVGLIATCIVAEGAIPDRSRKRLEKIAQKYYPDKKDPPILG